ncbi:MAG: hypothetical protein KF866_04140 [Phycisphaeraceae bacterium]|nr:hypothetical protein [Phycisphaeraceae bacterium]
MADLLEQGAAFLDGRRHAHLTRTVTYQRGADSVDLAATVGRTVFEQADESGFIRKVESRDFLVRRADLVLNGSETLPKAGDRVREADGAQTHVYEVMAPGGEPPYRWSDPYRKVLRIHTKHVATEGA